MKINWNTTLMIGVAILLAVLVSVSLNLLIVTPFVNSNDYLTKLRTIIQECPYSVDEYEEGVFDCSNMANMMDDWLEHHGYECWIVRWRKANPLEAGHAMVLVNGQLVETTRKSICFSLSDMVRGEYSRMVEIIDEPEQLGDSYIASEWWYPKRW